MSRVPTSRRRRAPAPAVDALPPWYVPPVDPTLLRLQAQLEAIEAERARASRAAEGGGGAHREPADDVIVDLDDLSAAILPGSGAQTGAHDAESYESQSLLDRLEDLERRLVMAENRARSAEARARAAAARAEDILFALPDLAHELRLLIDAGQPTVEHLEAAVERMRARVTPQRPAEPAEPGDLIVGAERGPATAHAD